MELAGSSNRAIVSQRLVRRPSRALDRTLRVSVIVKGLDGAFEIVGGLPLLLVSPATIQSTRAVG